MCVSFIFSTVNILKHNGWSSEGQTLYTSVATLDVISLIFNLWADLAVSRSSSAHRENDIYLGILCCAIQYIVSNFHQIAYLWTPGWYVLQMCEYMLISSRFIPGQLEAANLQGKVFLVTGANSGIGCEVSRYLASKGSTLYMVCSVSCYQLLDLRLMNITQWFPAKHTVDTKSIPACSENAMVIVRQLHSHNNTDPCHIRQSLLPQP